MKELVTEYTSNSVEDIYEQKSNDNSPKTLLILNHKYHHKNQKGMEMICEYLNYNLVYGKVSDIPDADVVFCPSHPHDVGQYPR